METERLILRPFSEDDAEDIYKYAKDPDVGPNAGWPPHTSIENSREIIKTVLMKETNFAIVDKATKQVIGSIGLMEDIRRDPESTIELGYWIGKPYWGQELVVEACKCLMHFAFYELNKEMVTLWHFEHNLRSKRVIEKLQFTYEGCLRNVRKAVDGTLLNGMFYSQSKEEFEKLNQK